MPEIVIQRLQLNNLTPVKVQWPGVHEDLISAQNRINQLTTALEAVAAAAGVDLKKVLGGSNG